MSLSSRVFFSNIAIFLGSLFVFGYGLTKYVESEVFKKSGFAFTDLVLEQKFLFAVFAVGVGVVSYLLSRQAVRPLGHVVKKLKIISTSSSEEALQIADVSKKVSSSSTGQASAVQETVATLAELTAMVNRSVDYVKQSNSKANDSNAKVLEGKQAVDQMIEAMHEISSSNNQIITQVNESNSQIQSLVGVIREISAKTNVINDIVFQTKLLSFNAAVEAARAGEHGKGFAVVAEEVGNLAHMSGNAAREIEDMLRASISKVESVVSISSETVTRLSETGNSKIDSGMGIASRCGEVLDEVVENVSEVTRMMSEVLASAEEQAGGISAISEAMNELDAETHGNSNVAHASSSYSAKFGAQVKEIEQIVFEFENIIGRQVNDENYLSEGQVYQPEQGYDGDIEDILSESLAEESYADVIPFELPESEPLRKPIRATTAKKAVGDIDAVPDHSDPRFEDF